MDGKRVVLEKTASGDGTAADRRVLATDVEVADTALSQARGLMFRREIPDDYALVMEIGSDGLLPFPRGPSRQVVHMLFVRFPIDVVWLVGNEVTKTAHMRPWRSIGVAKADRILELPAGTAEGIGVGDTIRIEETDLP